MAVHTQQYTTVIYVEQNLVHRDYFKRMHAHTGNATHDYMHTLVTTTDHERELAADQDSAEWKAWHSQQQQRQQQQQQQRQQQQQQQNRKRKKKEGNRYQNDSRECFSFVLF